MSESKRISFEMTGHQLALLKALAESGLYGNTIGEVAYFLVLDGLARKVESDLFRKLEHTRVVLGIEK